MQLGLLVGNSTLRLSLRDHERVVRARSFAWSDDAALSAKVAEFLDRARPGVVLFASVRDDHLASVRDLLAPRVSRWRRAGVDFPIPIENRYHTPAEVGVDRLLNAVAARRLAGGRGAIVADFGTAISLTVVTSDGAFDGGLIAAGAATILRGLAVSTPRLPEIESVRRDGFIQRSTRSAISTGVYFQVAGGVRAALSGLRAEMGGDPLILATGGEAPLFAPELESIGRVAPHLTMDGLFLASAVNGSV